MKKIFLILACFVLIANLAYASPPTSFEITYDAATKKITVVIYHQSYNIKKHYIDIVKMMLNGTIVETQRFHWQHTAREQTSTFAIPNAKIGDTITIQAFCNKGGQRSQDVKIK